MRKIGEKTWIELSANNNGNGNGKIDPRRAYLCSLPSGKKITLFFFDKRTASDIAFGNLLENGEAFAKRLIDSFQDENEEALIESVASDGELYGHHHPHGDMTLAYCIYQIVTTDSAKLTNYAAFLASYPTQYEAEIVENTSWSCIHGIERWRSDCGDNMGKVGWHQAWRKPLREAMDWLRDAILPYYEQEASKYLKDPWNARNHYIDVILDRSREQTDAFLVEQATRVLTEVEKRRVMKLLELQRYALLMFTSCGWFFDEISGIETVQVMMYAARAMQLAHDLFGVDLESDFMKILEKAPSNIPEFHDGARVYSIFVKPKIVDFPKISSQNTIIALFADNMNSTMLTPKLPNCCFKVSSSNVERRDDGRFRLIINRSNVYSSITLDSDHFGCAALWLGDHNVSCGVMQNMPQETFEQMKTELLLCFEKGQINEIIVLLSKYFGQQIYSLKDLFKDDQRYILNHIVAGGMKTAKELYNIVYHDNSAMLRFMKEIRTSSPKPLIAAAEIVLNMELDELLSAKTPDLTRIEKAIDEFLSLPVTLDSNLIAFKASQMVADEFSKLLSNPDDISAIQQKRRLIELLNRLPLSLNLWQAQNTAFKIAQNQYQRLKNQTDDTSKAWVAAFVDLCKLIGIRLA
jgi:hypothetical protein